MAGKSQDYIIRVQAENEQLKRKLADTRNKLKSHNSVLQSLSKSAAGYLGVFFGAGAVIGGIRDVTAAYDTQAKALAQVEAGLKATSGAAGKTFDELKKMASDLQKTTLFGDEEILQKATAQLLTFTNIAGTAFDRTQKAALDVSTRIGQDLTSTTIMLGKALNDPVANLGALGRSGIQFSESQKKVIKEMAATNRIAEAQDIILTELEKQYGGSAQAAAEAGTGGWTQLKNAFGDLKEVIGSLVVENQGSRGLSGWLTEITEKTTTFLDKNKGNIQDVFLGLLSGGGAAGIMAAKKYREELEYVAPTVDKVDTGLVKLTETIQKLGGKGTREALKETAKGLQGLGFQDMSGFDPSKLQLKENPFKDYVSKQGEEMRSALQYELDSLNAILSNGLADGIAAFADGLGTGGIEGAFQGLFNVIGGGLQTLGKSLIAFGVSMEAFKKAFTNPFAAIAAGTAAILAGSLVKKAASNLSSVSSGGYSSGGGSGGRGGGSASLQTQPMMVKVEGKLSMNTREFVVAIDDYKSRNSRITGK